MKVKGHASKPQSIVPKHPNPNPCDVEVFYVEEGLDAKYHDTFEMIRMCIIPVSSKAYTLHPEERLLLSQAPWRRIHKKLEYTDHMPSATHKVLYSIPLTPRSGANRKTLCLVAASCYGYCPTILGISRGVLTVISTVWDCCLAGAGQAISWPDTRYVYILINRLHPDRYCTSLFGDPRILSHEYGNFQK